MRVWSVTDRGLVRSENQDACAVLTPDGYTVAVVCDGMGGTQGGRMASTIAVETFTRELSRSLRPGMSAGQLEQAAGYAVALSNDAVREYGLAHPGFERMGTTLVSAVVRDDLALVSNVGDSRAYHITREGIRQVSRDHSVVEDMVEKGPAPSPPQPHHTGAGDGARCGGGCLPAEMAAGGLPAAVLRRTDKHRVRSGASLRGDSQRAAGHVSGSAAGPLPSAGSAG